MSVWRMLCPFVSWSTSGLPVIVRTDSSTADDALPADDRCSFPAVLLAAAAAAHWTATGTHPTRTQSVAVRRLLPPRRTARPAAAAPAVCRRTLPSFSDCERPAADGIVVEARRSGLWRPRNDEDQCRLRCRLLSHLSLNYSSHSRLWTVLGLAKSNQLNDYISGTPLVARIGIWNVSRNKLYMLRSHVDFLWWTGL